MAMLGGGDPSAAASGALMPSAADSSTPYHLGYTALQGYDVRLDIKTSEYKSFDDKVDGRETTLKQIFSLGESYEVY